MQSWRKSVKARESHHYLLQKKKKSCEQMKCRLRYIHPHLMMVEHPHCPCCVSQSHAYCLVWNALNGTLTSKNGTAGNNQICIYIILLRVIKLNQTHLYWFQALHVIDICFVCHWREASLPVSQASSTQIFPWKATLQHLVSPVWRGLPRHRSPCRTSPETRTPNTYLTSQLNRSQVKSGRSFSIQTSSPHLCGLTLFLGSFRLNMSDLYLFLYLLSVLRQRLNISFSMATASRPTSLSLIFRSSLSLTLVIRTTIHDGVTCWIVFEPKIYY